MKLAWIPAAMSIAMISLTASAATRSVVSSKTTQFPISPQFASITSNPLYQGSQSTAQNPLYTGLATAPVVITLTGHSAVGLPSYSTVGGGRIYSRFVSDTAGSPPTIAAFTTAGVKVAEYRDLDSDNDGISDLSRSPSVSNTGAIVFKSLHSVNGIPSTPVLMYKPASSDFTGTLPATWFNDATSLSRPAISPDGSQVAVAIQKRNSSGVTESALYAGSPTSGQPITINGNGFRYAAPQIDATGGIACIETSLSTGQSAVFYTTRDSSSGLATGRRQHSPFIADTDNKLSFALSATGDLLAVCDGSSISLIVAPREASSGLPTGAAGAAPVPLVSAGESIGGMTLQSLSVAPGSFTGDGELMFYATYEGGGTGLFAVTVPEPTSIALLASALPLIGRRRR